MTSSVVVSKGAKQMVQLQQVGGRPMLRNIISLHFYMIFNLSSSLLQKKVLQTYITVKFLQ